MATVTAFIRSTKTDKAKPVNVRFRLRDGRTGIDKETGKEYEGIQLFHKSEITVSPDRWDDRQQKIKARVVIDERERNIFDNAVADRKKIIKDIYQQEGKTLTSDVLETEIEKRLHPERYPVSKLTFFEVYDKFLSENTVAFSTLKKRRTIKEAFCRFEASGNAQLNLNTMTADTLKSFERFLKHESGQDGNLPERSINTIGGFMRYARTFIYWCINNGYTTNNPFNRYKVPVEKYGTPFYLTVAERNELYHFDLSNHPALARQRDVFIFQCVIGCRIGDLQKFTKDNVINGAIQYVAEKTKGEEPKTIRVPLNSIATEILAKYAGLEGNRLLPLIQPQKHNEELKRIFTMVGITRKVTVLNKLTRTEEVRPLNELASSHLARRTFCANLYKMVKDPNLVGALSGHSEGSKAFARYRDIDEADKVELVKMLE